MRPDARGDLEALNPTGRFSNRADDYVKYRPDYPAAAIDAVLEGLGEPQALVVADVGAGTGIATRQVADRGARVVAIEPNAPMREAAAPHPRVEWREGTAEATGLPTGLTDVVLSAQAFHWFRPEQALAEFHRVLRRGGRVALMWNMRDDDDPLTREYMEAIVSVAEVHAIEDRTLGPGVLDQDGLFTKATLVTFPHAQRLTRDGLIGRAASASYVPKDPERFARLTALLDALYNRHRDADGMVTMRYLTDVHRATAR